MTHLGKIMTEGPHVATSHHDPPGLLQENSWSHHTLLDIPFFLTGETLIRTHWNFNGDRIMALRVYGASTLYVAAQCPPLGTGKKEQKSALAALGTEVGAFPTDSRVSHISGWWFGNIFYFPICWE